MARLKDIIRSTAFDQGFFAAGFAKAEPLSEIGHLNHWLSKNFCASISWMRRNPAARCNPTSLLPGAKSVICCALAYGEIPPHPPFKKGGWGDLNKARFARGLDYHELVGKKLAAVCDAIKRRAPYARCKTCVDTSPILEKPFAVRSGIGWQGKNSVVIHPERGSYFVLGEIITDLEIEPDGPVANRCGDCGKCMDACPTRAIAEPYVVDARRCLSYLTIEHKGAVVYEFAKQLKPGQYGCDICQEVCPYNNLKN